MGHEKKVARAYRRELWLAMAVYIVLLFGAIRFGRPMAQGTLRTIILLTPMLGFGLMIWAIARHVSRIDEYMRRTLLETLSIAAAITAAVTFSYGFLETAGFPRISMFTVWPVMGASWGLVCLARFLLAR
ncbi:MAG: hypothetical protein JWP34_2589 [Massilia sp.]|jgi:hypothetical protein|nr:hypothetical protein [Massilia sp.]